MWLTQKMSCRISFPPKPKLLDRTLCIYNTSKHQSKYNIETNVYTGADFPDILRATKELSDWFTLGIFLKVEYSKLETLKRDYPSDHNHCRQEMLMFWISSGNATWSILVKTLRDDMKEPGLAERIEKMYIQ